MGSEVLTMKLPPDVKRKPCMDDGGKPTGEVDTELVEHEPGDGEEIELEWPSEFPDGPDDLQKKVQTLSLATGSQPIMAQQTAAEIAAKLYDRDPDEEWKRLAAANAEQDQKQADMFKQGMASQMGAAAPTGKAPSGVPGMGGAQKKPNPFAKGGPPGGKAGSAGPFGGKGGIPQIPKPPTPKVP